MTEPELSSTHDDGRRLSHALPLTAADAIAFWVAHALRADGSRYQLHAIAAATGIGAARVAAAKHFPTDVHAGAMAGSARGLVQLTAGRCAVAVTVQRA